MDFCINLEFVLQFFNAFAQWAHANETCHYYGGQLVSIKTRATLEFLRQAMRNSEEPVSTRLYLAMKHFLLAGRT